MITQAALASLACKARYARQHRQHPSRHVGRTPTIHPHTSPASITACRPTSNNQPARAYNHPSNPLCPLMLCHFDTGGGFGLPPLFLNQTPPVPPLPPDLAREASGVVEKQNGRKKQNRTIRLIAPKFVPASPER